MGHQPTRSQPRAWLHFHPGEEGLDWPRAASRDRVALEPGRRWSAGCCQWQTGMLAIMLLLLLGGAIPESAADGSPPPAAPNPFQAAEQKYKADPRNAEAVWQFARACFDAADAATNKDVRAEIAERGITACRQAMAQASNSAPTHYYLGLNLGQLASTRGFSALKLVAEMESQLLVARQLDARFDYAGPDRSLGLLYRDAPSMLSVGSRTKARQHLREAIQLWSHYPGNRFELIGTLLKWGERTAARRELKSLEEIWPLARQEYSGPVWAGPWAEWEAKLQEYKRNLEEPSRLETPRH